MCFLSKQFIWAKKGSKVWIYFNSASERLTRSKGPHFEALLFLCVALIAACRWCASASPPANPLNSVISTPQAISRRCQIWFPLTISRKGNIKSGRNWASLVLRSAKGIRQRILNKMLVFPAGPNSLGKNIHFIKFIFNSLPLGRPGVMVFLVYSQLSFVEFLSSHFHFILYRHSCNRIWFAMTRPILSTEQQSSFFYTNQLAKPNFSRTFLRHSPPQTHM